jgi:hypothetical protein
MNQKKTAGRGRRLHRIRFVASGLRTRSRLVPPAAGKAEKVKVERDAVQHESSVRPDRRLRKSAARRCRFGDAGGARHAAVILLAMSRPPNRNP